MSKRIQLSQGLDAIVDDEDYEVLRQWRWSVSEVKGYTRYAVRQDPDTRRLVLMHRQIMEATKGKVVDHINGDGLDNRRGNLRLCTQAQNLANRGRQKNKTLSRYKGVVPHYNRWAARCNGKHVGMYACETAAALAYDRAAKNRYGDYARLNLGG
jgi:hypothetical protein